jgi:hypothetical protein
MPYLRRTTAVWWAELKRLPLGRQCTACPSEFFPIQSVSQRPPLFCAEGPNILARQTKKTTYGTKQHGGSSHFTPRSSQMPNQCVRQFSTTTVEQVRCPNLSRSQKQRHRIVFFSDISFGYTECTNYFAGTTKGGIHRRTGNNHGMGARVLC